MKKCVLVVRSNPVAGREDEFNDWYSNQHLADVLRVPGFISAQRFKLSPSEEDRSWQYLALYEFETDDPAATLAALTARAGGPEMALSEAMDLQAYSAVPWVAVTEKLSLGR